MPSAGMPVCRMCEHRKAQDAMVLVTREGTGRACSVSRAPGTMHQSFQERALGMLALCEGCKAPCFDHSTKQESQDPSATWVLTRPGPSGF